MTTIRSSSNAVLKRVRAVLAGAERDALVLLGLRLVLDARRAGIRPEVVLVADDRPDERRVLAEAGLEPRPVRAGLLRRVGGLRHPPGTLALAPLPPRPGADVLRADSASRVAVSAGIADPGNLGALARVAEAAGCEALAVVAGGVRPWNEKALRGSMGSLFRLPVLEAEDAAALAAELAGRSYRQVVARTRGGTPYDRFDWSGPLALWLPSETAPPPTAAEDFEAVTIPMAGAAESLNVTAAAAVLLFAAARAAPTP